MPKHRRKPGRGHVAALSFGWLAFGAAALGDPIDVGSGANHAGLVVQFGDGALYEFAVSFDGAISGLGLFDVAEAETTLETTRLDFGFGVFIDGIAFDGHSNAGFGGGENYWHYWTREAGDVAWTFASLAAGDRLLGDGDADGWVYGSAAPPVPEPSALALLGMATTLAAFRRRRQNGR